jgi:hypothetical protein
MCSKPNPPERETCQYCQARLKPLTGGTGAFDLQPEEQVPDWLKGLRPSAASEPVSNPPELSQPDPEQESQPSSPPASQPQPDSTDWLAGIRLDGGDMQEAAEEAAEPEPTSDDTPDWLKRVRERQKEDELTASESGEADPDGLPAWLKWQDGAAPELPDEAAAGDQSAEPALQEPVETPEWLKELTRAGSSGDAAAIPGDPTNGTPDWLKSLNKPPVQPVESPSDGDLPEWLKPPVESGVGNAEPPARVKEEDDLGWMAAAVGADAGEARGPVQPATPAFDELPDWLLDGSAAGAPTDLPASEAPLAAASEAAASTPGAPETTASNPAGPVRQTNAFDELPDWLTGAAAGAAVMTGAFTPGGKDDGPDWLHSLEAEPGPASPSVTQTPTGNVYPFLADDDESAVELAGLQNATLPDWLARPQAEAHKPEAQESATQPSQAAATGDASLSPGNLPGWLEAMRPSAGTASQSDQALESSGPLSGLRDALPAEPSISQLQKPPAYLMKLQVSESQKQQADLLEKSIRSEAESLPLPARRAAGRPDILRWAIALALSAVILWALLFNTPQFAIPAIPAETVDANAAIQNTPPKAPVLVAVDYEPGLAGEMEAAAGPAIDHLMIRGAYLTFVSTLPTGPAQAERLTAQIFASTGRSYQAPAQYVNLGYIPGGPTGLLAFASAPDRVFPFALGGGNPWEQEALIPVRHPADFKLAVVLTDNPDRARAWIEQVQPLLGGTPLVMVLSAQAEPSVRPYYAHSGGQVQGLVTGVAGGAAYESLTGQAGTAGKTWNAYSLATLAAVGMIILGMLLSGGLSLLGRRTKPGQEAR